jgi:transcriptional regulator with XRE-family HTH domain
MIYFISNSNISRRYLKMAVNKEELIKKIGHRLKLMRVAAQMEQSKLAEKTGIKQGNISTYERGVRTINIVDLFKLAEGLGCKASDIIDLERALV